MRVGNRVYCRERLESWFYVGRWYIIDRIELDYAYVIDNDRSLVIFSLNNKDTRRFKDFFYTEQDIRKIKLKKLNDKV